MGISESGLYKLIFRSDKPEARVFLDWVTRVILPSIRKNGSYVAGQEGLATGEMSPEALLDRALLAARSILEEAKRRRALSAV